MSGQIIDSGDVHLWAEQTGAFDDEAVLLIAGANASAMMWPDDLISLLRDAGYRIIRYDHRDTGQSAQIDFDQNPYSIEDMADDAVKVLDGLGIDQAHVVGLSLGGTIGQVLALDHPQRLLSLTVMGSAALDVDFAGNWVRALQGEEGRAGSLPMPNHEVVSAFEAPLDDREAELDRRVEQWRLLSGDKLPFDADDYRQREIADMRHSGRVAAPMAHALARPVSLERGRELVSVAMPTLVVQGHEDPLNPPPHGRHLAALIPNARLLELECVGHSLPREAFTDITAALTAHWAGEKSILA